MSETLTAILTGPSSVIAGQPANFVVKVSNSGSTDASISGIYPLVTPGSMPFHGGKWIAPTGGSATVSASGSAYFPVSLVFFAPTLGQGNNNAEQGRPTCSVTFLVASAAGSNISPPALTVPIVPGGQSVPPVNGGQFDFSNAFNSGMTLLLP